MTNQQAATKAAPGEQRIDSLRHQNKLLAEALGACILASGIVRKDIDGFSGPELLHFAKDLQSMLEAAPQQEAQEPTFWTRQLSGQGREFLKQKPFTTDWTPLYTAPQPAPAPLSDDVAKDAARYRLLRRGRHWSVIDGIGNDLLRAEALDAAVDAALAAQKDTP